jgi:5'(3')-deoxyribonucleotidase
MPKAAAKPIIAVDIDEVLAPHFQGLIDWYNQKYSTKLTLKHNHPTDPRPWGTSDYSTAIKRVQKYFSTPSFLNSKPYQESVTALTELNESYDLVIITGRDTIIKDVTTKWLNKHYGELFADAHFTARYSLEGREKNKSAILEEIGAEYLIDDALHNCISAVMAGIDALLFGEYPWNEAKKLPAGVTRVKNWQEVLEYFENEQGR